MQLESYFIETVTTMKHSSEKTLLIYFIVVQIIKIEIDNLQKQ